MSNIIISATATTGFLLFPLLLALSPFRGGDSYNSKATYYGSPDSLGTPNGACGYGGYGSTVLGGAVAGVPWRHFLNGSLCGACYHLKCAPQNLCSNDGTNVVVTDAAGARHAEFILSGRAYAQLARPGLAARLLAMGVVEVESRRIPCRFPGYNLHVMVHEYSRKEEYLALSILYQGGDYQLSAAEIVQEEQGESLPMGKSFGSVWELSNPPAGDLSLKLQLLAPNGAHKSVKLTNVIRADWEGGSVYDSNVQIY